MTNRRDEVERIIRDVFADDSDHVVAMETVKLCPMCGGLAVVDSADNSTKVRCLDDNCGVSLTRFRLVGDHRSAAIAAWNRRSALEAVSSIHEAEPVTGRKVVADYYRRGGNHSMADEILRDNWRDGASQSEIDLVAAIDTALAHPAPISKGVTVKALVWDGDVSTRPAPAWYFLNEVEGKGWRYHYGSAAPYFPSKEEARAAAQINFADGVKSCLSHTAGEIE